MSENSQSPQIFTNFSFSAKNKSSAWLQSSNNTKSFLQVAFSYNLLVCQGNTVGSFSPATNNVCAVILSTVIIGLIFLWM